MSKLSTVGTLSGATDLLRVYYAAFGEVFCRSCDIPLRTTSLSDIQERIFQTYEQKKVTIVAPLIEKRKGAFEKEIEKFRNLGFSKLRVNSELFHLQDDTQIKIDAKKLNTIEVLIDKIEVSALKKQRLERALHNAYEYGKGLIKIEDESERFVVFNTSASCPQCGESAPRLDPRYFSHSASFGQCTQCEGTGSAVADMPADLFQCPSCKGGRLSQTRPLVRVAATSFEDLHVISLKEVHDFVEKALVPLGATDRAKQKVVSELERLLKTAVQLGLGHLTLNREGSSLSPGDLQRLRLASLLSNDLRGALYVFDEPCQGLTAVEVDFLCKQLMQLKGRGASIVVVEHHPDFLRQCDVVYLMGPGAGVYGGQIVGVFSGEKFAKQQTAATGEHPRVSYQPTLKSKSSSGILFQDIAVRKLKKKSLSLSSGALNILRGPAGSGKNSFLELCLLPALQVFSEGNKNSSSSAVKLSFCRASIFGDATVEVIQDVRPATLARSSRRTVASALEILEPMRKLFAMLPQSQILGLTPSHFSWHSALGRCSSCEGRGFIELPHRYGPPVKMDCESCLGARLSPRSLQPRYRGLHFADIIGMQIQRAHQFFEAAPKIRACLERAVRFGLGYVGLGQSLDELSGGEIQRLTLTMELKRSNLEGAWFVLVHPGTGLHTPDIHILGTLLRNMIDQGASVVMIENREEFLTFADVVFDFDEIT